MQNLIAESIDVGALLNLETGQALDVSNFTAGEGVTQAQNVNEFIVYNQTNGHVYYDADGSGTASIAVLVADITDGLVLDNLSFVCNQALIHEVAAGGWIA